ncbi:MAG: hypothetical protein EPN84_06130, partial [Legionella sp.]
MANSTKESQEINSDTENTTPTKTKQGSLSHINHYIISGLSFIIAITAIFIAFYTVQLHKNLNQKMLAGDGNLAGQLEQLKKIQFKTQVQVENKNGDLSQLHKELQIKMDELQTQLQKASSQQLYQTQDWLLLKARYYLELAEVNNFWSSDFKSSVALLQNADNSLKELNDPPILAIRQAIAKEISEIKSIPQIDTTGILSQLNALQTSVTKLKIATSIAITPSKTADDETSSWRARMKESAHLFSQLVVVRRDNEEIKPLLSPLYQSLLHETIIINLQEAQWAV